MWMTRRGGGNLGKRVAMIRRYLPLLHVLFYISFLSRDFLCCYCKTITIDINFGH